MCFDPRCVAGIGSALESFSPDVVHLQTHFFLARVAQVWSHRLRIPSIATCHCRPENFLLNAPLKRGLLTGGLRRGVGHLYWKDAVAVYSREDLVTTPIAATADLLRRRGVRSRVEVLANGVDTTLFSARRQPCDEAIRVKYGITQEKALLFVGRLDGDKGIPALIQFAESLALHSGSHLIVCGSGTQEAGFRRAISERGLGARVTATGTVPQDDLSSIYRLASALVVLNRNETQPLAVLEAFASGIPVVGLRSPNLEQTVVHRVNGLLGDSVEETTALSQLLLDDDRLRRVLGVHARETAEAHYSLATVADRFLECYLAVGRVRASRQA